MTWHADTELLSTYASGRLDIARAASLEAHMVGCSRCQAAATSFVDAPRLDAMWDEVADAVDAPRPRAAERLMRRLGVSDASARLVAATPSLRGAWMSAIALVFLLSAIAAGTEAPRLRLFFALAAPLLPLVGVATAFSSRFDRTAEVAAAAPMSSMHLLFVRGIATLAPTAAVAAVAAVAAAGGTPIMAAWLLPSLALCAISVAAATWVDPVRAAGSVASLWVAGVLTAEIRLLGGGSDVAGAMTAAHTQLIAAGLVAAAAVVAVARRSQFEFGRF